MPSVVQSRIAGYEAQARNSDHSLIDLHDWVIDGMPPSPISSPQPLPPSPPIQKLKPKPKPKPPALQVKNSASVKKSPPLPPRRSTSTDADSNTDGKRGNHVAASSVSSFHSVSLSSATPSRSSLTESFEEISIAPPPPPLPQRPTTVPPPSVSSPAQQSHTSPPTPTPLPYVPRRAPPPPPSTSRASDRSSIQSLPSASSSLSRRSSGSVVQTPTLTTTLPLPPPSSILSPSSPTNGGSPTALLKTKRPTPVPTAARNRYISVFNANIIQRRRAEAQKPEEEKPKKLSHAQAKRTRKAAGWRGLSVDLITATPEELRAHDERVKGKQRESELFELVVDENVGPGERLEGGIVGAIWSRSRIENSKLVEIWNECDPEGKGSLDVDSFVRGMWRIDEHLRRTQAQTSALRNASSTSLTSLRSGLGSLKIKSGRPVIHRSTSRSSLGTSLSRSSSVNSSHRGANLYAEYPPPPPVPKIVLR
ncbi:hypothetical protein D9756_001473 [Leucocoprinus leucothites]|uniref:EH domain-containing protein n=1 Tax=Leucocoprinus leucothites TaxID=201217 RepID=A0A8H5G3T3_9AGAR|nr:hypothetical protein D9756_001473 [Leucoagaricus leucothites]